MIIRTFESPEMLAQAAAAELIALATAAIAARGTCSIALSGGSTPKRLFQVLAAAPSSCPWDHIELWWGDERCVPVDHPDSNYRMTRENLIEPLKLDSSRIHRIAGEVPDPEVGAAGYERMLVSALGTPPVFDVMLLGMGSDGHTASLFPGSPALTETTRWVVANPVTSPLVGGTATRITLTAAAINAARHVRFLVAGADKATTLAQVLAGPPGQYPSQLIAPTNGDLAWLVDKAAASRLA